MNHHLVNDGGDWYCKECAESGDSFTLVNLRKAPGQKLEPLDEVAEPNPQQESP